MNSNFYLEARPDGRYVAVFTDKNTGKRAIYRNTGTKNRDEALIQANKWLETGIPARRQGRPPIYQKEAVFPAGVAGIAKALENIPDLDKSGARMIAAALQRRGLIELPGSAESPGNADFIEYLENFWDYDNSPYVAEKLAHKQSIGRRYCYEASKRIGRFWKPAFSGQALGGVTREEIKKFTLELSDKGFSAGYLNMIINAGIIPLGYAAREGLIEKNPAAGLMRFVKTGPGRGVLTPLEARQVFSQKWPDKRAYAGNLLAMTSGLRHGEVIALRRDSIDPTKPILNITHTWSTKDGLKAGTKNGETRKVPVLPEVKKLLLELLKENPHSGENPFIFWGVHPDKPTFEGDFLRWGFRKAMDRAGIDYRGRHICFHSHRHFYCARMADKMTAEQVQRISGHKSRAVFEAYADHIIDENIIEMGAAGAEVFGNILKFRKQA